MILEVGKSYNIHGDSSIFATIKYSIVIDDERIFVDEEGNSYREDGTSTMSPEMDLVSEFDRNWADKYKLENINHPAHYNQGKFEVIDVIEDWGLGFCLGNAVKYIARAGKKDPLAYKEDLKKAIWYLERAAK
jgi:hypothetical protein